MGREKNGCMKTWGSEGFALPITSFDTAIFSVYSSFVCAHWTKKQREAAGSLKKVSWAWLVYIARAYLGSIK